ncbi:hypothetical protein OH77DRAFT_873749 [Trametes cingulata]|nr:hypothetical protein OH77DRAFT_873749 [Trametes cingulata]
MRPPTVQTLSLLSDVVAVAPLVGLTFPPPQPVRHLVRLISVVGPTSSPIPAIGYGGSCWSCWSALMRSTEILQRSRGSTSTGGRSSSQIVWDCEGLYDMISQASEEPPAPFAPFLTYAGKRDAGDRLGTLTR